MHDAPSQVVLELLELAGHQGLGLSQRHVAALSALEHLLHGGLAVVAAAGAAPEHEALHLPDVLALQTLHHGVHRLLHLELWQLRVGTLPCTWSHWYPYGHKAFLNRAQICHVRKPCTRVAHKPVKSIIFCEKCQVPKNKKQGGRCILQLGYATHFIY